MRSVSSDKIRNLLLRADAGDVLPAAIAQAMDREQVAAGLVRGAGVLEDVVLRAHGEGAPRKLAGRAHAVVLEGSVELAEVVLRAVIARETDRGLETLAGEIVSARVVSLDAHVLAFDDVPAHAAAAAAAKEPPPRPVLSREVPKASAWADAAAASSPEIARPAAAPPPSPSSPSSPSSPAIIPPRPVRAKVEDDQPVPDAGDIVEHFAFGACDVVKSEGDRLHLRLPRDQRVKEIALEMLRVTPLPPEGDRKRWRLDRRM